jgi:GNAT superfamily N-acetyltransferase
MEEYSMRILLSLLIGLLSTLCLNGMEPAPVTLDANTLTYKITPVRSYFYIAHALQENKEVGYLDYWYIKEHNKGKSYAIIKELAVLEQYRRNGIAGKLFEQLIKELKPKGLSRITWEAVPQDHTMSLMQLVEVYRKIIAKIQTETPGEFEILGTPEEHEATGEVHLQFTLKQEGTKKDLCAPLL